MTAKPRHRIVYLEKKIIKNIFELARIIGVKSILFNFLISKKVPNF